MSDKPKNPNLIPFEKGNPGGPGRPKRTTEEKQAARMTRETFNNCARKYMLKTYDQLRKIVEDEMKEVQGRKEVTSLELMVISVIVKAIKTGDQNKMNWFLEQLFGKLTEHHHIKSEVVNHATILKGIEDAKKKSIENKVE